MDIEIIKPVYVEGKPYKAGQTIKECKKASLLIGLGKAKKAEPKKTETKKPLKSK